MSKPAQTSPRVATIPDRKILPLRPHYSFQDPRLGPASHSCDDGDIVPFIGEIHENDTARLGYSGELSERLIRVVHMFHHAPNHDHIKLRIVERNGGGAAASKHHAGRDDVMRDIVDIGSEPVLKSVGQ
jgi:hypothetical protein